MVFTGGLVQFVVGWMEMNLGNTFAGALFLMYGSFNFSFACMFFPAFGVIAAYTKPDGTPDPEMAQALGLYFILWAIVSFIFLLGSFRSSYPIVFTLVSIFRSQILRVTPGTQPTLAGGHMARRAKHNDPLDPERH